MTLVPGGHAANRRDLLVQQLLEERRQRLQQKLDEGAAAASPERALEGLWDSGETETLLRPAWQSTDDFQEPLTQVRETPEVFKPSPGAFSGSDEPLHAGGLMSPWMAEWRFSSPTQVYTPSSARPKISAERAAWDPGTPPPAGASTPSTGGLDLVQDSGPLRLGSSGHELASMSRPSSRHVLSGRREAREKDVGAGSEEELGLVRAAAEFTFGKEAAAAAAAGSSRQGRAASRRPQSAPPSRKGAPQSKAQKGDWATPEPRKKRPAARTAEKEAKTSQQFEQRLQHWEIRHQASKQKQLQAKQEKEMRELEQCTFQPSINSRSEFYARRSRGCFIEPLPDRLFHEADKRASLRHKAKELLEADSLCSYTFQPQINSGKGGSTGNGRDRTPIHVRASSIQQQKQERVRSAQMAEEQRSERWFQPKISERSERMVQKRRDRLYRSASHGHTQCLRQLGPVEERLYAEAQEKEHRRAILQEFMAADSVSQPSVDDTSRKICKSSVYFQGAQQDFLTRQQTFELARQRRMEVRTHHADAECSFRPAITETSRQLVANNPDLLGETPEERVDRLAVKDAARRDQLRDELEQLYNRDCTFKPEINAVSEMLAASRYEDSAAAVAEYEGESQAHERLYRAGLTKSRLNEDSRSDDYSFRPQLDPRSTKRFAHVKSRYGNSRELMESIRQEQERKAEYILEKRREKEEEQRADCTFAPEVRDAYQEPSKPVVVSGLGRYFELKSMALKKQQEQQEREQKVFRPDRGGARCGGVTIPEPFQLSASEGPRVAEDSQWLERHQECTFTPETNETHNREIIRQIMGAVEVH